MGKERRGREMPWEPSEVPPDKSAREPAGPAPAYGTLAAGLVLLGRFRLLADVGDGNLGRVFKAHDDRFGMDVLLQTLRPALAADARLVENLQREIRLAQRIAHPAVARTYDLWLAGAFGFVAAEFVEGASLRDELRRKGALAPALALRLSAELLEGLAAAHELGVVHRDVKPENIFLADDGQLKIAHFGIAQGLDVALAARLVGTPEYMSPEQLAAERADARTDLYSAGLVMFEMLTGRLPFAATERTALATQRRHASPMRASAFVPALPAPLDELLLRLLNREREGRFPTAEAALAALRQIRAA